MDFGATNHITGDLDNFTMHDHYTNTDQIHATNGVGMDSTHIPTSHGNIGLNNVLRVPYTHKNLIFVHCFTLDSDMFIEFHPYFFLIKDQKPKKVVLHMPCKGGLRPLPPLSSKF
jgi:hypothetical protein